MSSVLFVTENLERQRGDYSERTRNQNQISAIEYKPVAARQGYHS